MSEFMSGWELLDYWGVKNFELFQFVKNSKIRPYDQFGRLKPYIGYVSPKERDRLKQQLEYQQKLHQEHNPYPELYE